MNILSLIYSIPPPPHSPSATYPSSMSSSTDSTRPSLPGSPSSKSSNHFHRESSSTIYDDVDSRRFSQETAKYCGELFGQRDPSERTRSSRFPLYFSNICYIHAVELSEYHHPYSAAAARMSQLPDDDPETPVPRPSTLNGKRSMAPPPARPQPSSPPHPGPSGGLRPRAASGLPPPGKHRFSFALSHTQFGNHESSSFFLVNPGHLASDCQFA